ncbi:hypothetical protein [Streptomyces vinaceus]|uniref:hypothetical protein n=1 Tax=Streptomyces vinaceus TaxID=1960 RepID=UPI0036A565D5
MADENIDETSTAPTEDPGPVEEAAPETVTEDASETPAARQDPTMRELAQQPAEEVQQQAPVADDFKGQYETLKAEFEVLKAKYSETADRADSAERFKEELAAATGRVAEVERRLLRQKVGSEFGIPSALIDRLSGDDYEAMALDAKQLSAFVGAPSGGLGKGGLDPNETAFDAKKFVARERSKLYSA